MSFYGYSGGEETSTGPSDTPAVTDTKSDVTLAPAALNGTMEASGDLQPPAKVSTGNTHSGSNCQGKSMGKVRACGLVDKALNSRSKGLGFDSPLLVMCRSVGQTSHSVLPLPTQQ